MLIRAVNELPCEVRNIVSIRYVDGLTFEEISERLNIATTTCRRRWLEGCDMLRQRLRCLLDE